MKKTVYCVDVSVKLCLCVDVCPSLISVLQQVRSIILVILSLCLLISTFLSIFLFSIHFCPITPYNLPPNHPLHPYLCSQWYGPGWRDCWRWGNRCDQVRWWRGVSNARRALHWGVHYKRLWNKGVWLFLQGLQWAHHRKQDGRHLWPCPVRCDRWGRCKLPCAFQQIHFKALIKASIEFAVALNLAEESSRELSRSAKRWCWSKTWALFQNLVNCLDRNLR